MVLLLDVQIVKNTPNQLYVPTSEYAEFAYVDSLLLGSGDVQRIALGVEMEFVRTTGIALWPMTANLTYNTSQVERKKLFIQPVNSTPVWTGNQVSYTSNGISPNNHDVRLALMNYFSAIYENRGAISADFFKKFRLNG